MWETTQELMQIVECFWVQLLQLGQKERKGVGSVRPGSPVALPSSLHVSLGEHTPIFCRVFSSTPSTDKVWVKDAGSYILAYSLYYLFMDMLSKFVQTLLEPDDVAWLLPRTAHSRISVSITYTSSCRIAGFGE